MAQDNSLNMDNSHSLLEELGIENLPAEERDMLVAELGEILFTGVTERAWNDLDLQKQDTLTSLLKAIEDKPDDENRHASLMQFFETQVPEFKTYVQKEIELFRKRYQEALSELE